MNDQPERLFSTVPQWIDSVEIDAAMLFEPEGMAEFLRSIGCVADLAQTHLNVGQTLQEKGYLKEAEDAYRTAIAVKRDFPDAYILLGVALQSQGNLEGAVTSYRQALEIFPGSSEVYSNLGVALQGTGRTNEAIDAFETSIRLDPQRAEAYANLGAVLLTAGRLDAALLALAKAAAIKPDCAITHANIGAAWKMRDDPARAITSLRTAITLNPEYTDAHAELANLLQAQGQIGECVEVFRTAIALGDRRASIYCNLGVALQDLGHQAEAISAYQRAIELDAAFADAHSNLGVVLLEQDRFDDAIAAFERSVQLDPDNVKAYCNLAIALDNKKQSKPAEAAFRKAIEINPSYADSYSNLAMLFIQEGRLDEALLLLSMSASLNHDHGRPLGASVRVPSYRVKHDREQLALLSSEGLLESKWDPYRDHLDTLWQAVHRGEEGVESTEVAGDDVSKIAPSYNRLVYVPACVAMADGALNSGLEVKAIEDRYLDSKPEIVWMDDFLSNDALVALRGFCNKATVWKEEYANGYLGATLKGGFASPLLLQIAEELRTRLPRVFGTHRLEQAWAFKYDSKMRGINVHADFAAVNVNFWITPDEACRSPDRGGLVVWNKEAPKDWSFYQYNADEKQIRRHLAESNAGSVTVPYRSNRCLIFNSTLFHETDQFEFHDAYDQRRINITLLFGKGLRMR